MKILDANFSFEKDFGQIEFGGLRILDAKCSFRRYKGNRTKSNRTVAVKVSIHPRRRLCLHRE